MTHRTHFPFSLIVIFLIEKEDEETMFVIRVTCPSKLFRMKELSAC